MADTPDTAAAGSQTPAADTTPPATGTQTPATGTTALGGAAGTETTGIPEKYQVKGTDGKIDMQASVAKLSEGYLEAQKLIGDPGARRPKSADEYTMPEIDKDAKLDTKALADDPDFKAFKALAWDAGYTDKQLALAVNTYVKLAPQLVEAQSAQNASDTLATMNKEWGDKVKENSALAVKAIRTYAGDGADAVIQALGNSWPAIKLLAAIGRDLGEDKTPAQAGGADSMDFKAKDAELMEEMSKLKPNDPRRDALIEQRKALYAKNAR
jgi:hypothetical protein